MQEAEGPRPPKEGALDGCHQPVLAAELGLGRLRQSTDALWLEHQPQDPFKRGPFRVATASSRPSRRSN